MQTCCCRRKDPDPLMSPIREEAGWWSEGKLFPGSRCGLLSQQVWKDGAASALDLMGAIKCGPGCQVVERFVPRPQAEWEQWTEAVDSHCPVPGQPAASGRKGWVLINVTRPTAVPGLGSFGMCDWGQASTTPPCCAPP